MKTFTDPQVLTDELRLQEIFDLRVEAWENSPSAAGIKRENYPRGFFDALDAAAVHWVSFEDGGRIIAAARLAVVDDADELPYPEILTNVSLPPERPFLFYSRLVIHQNYRKCGLKEKFDLARLRYQLENRFAFSIATANPKRAAELIKYGWQNLGEVSDFHDPSFPFRQSHLLLLLEQDIRLPAEAPADEQEFRVCGFQRAMMETEDQ